MRRDFVKNPVYWLAGGLAALPGSQPAGWQPSQPDKIGKSSARAGWPAGRPGKLGSLNRPPHPSAATPQPLHGSL